MNLSLSDSVLLRQRSRQWSPLVTQQFRLRHIYQIFGMNFPHLPRKGSYYYTLHLTTMSAPFYTSEKMVNSNPKWEELDQRNLPNLAATAIVLRVWQHVQDTSDKIIATWGINLSGLVYLGNKVTELQTAFFAANTVIFNIRGGFFTSHQILINCCSTTGSDREGKSIKEAPFAENVNLISTGGDGTKKIYRKTTIQTHKSEIRDSYDVNKLRKLHSLQVTIRNKRLDVEVIKEKIEVKSRKFENTEKEPETLSSSPSNVRYAPQLLTMKSVNKMLEQKPTQMQRQEMMKIRNEIEVQQFRSKLLSQEKDKKSALIRKFKNQLNGLIDANDEKNSALMESYYVLNKEGEKLKELKKTIVQHQDLLLNILTNLNYRRRQLLQQLLFIYPIQQVAEKKFTIHGISLPNSDLLSECNDTGLSIALGYITHILLMSSKFLQVPLRYPMTHCGSRSFITDHISPNHPDRDFPLFTKGKDKIQFTYAVYLMNKNVAQLRWLFFMHTNELQATLPNLLTFLEGKDAREMLPHLTYTLDEKSDNLDEEIKRKFDNVESLNNQKTLSRKYNRILKSCECGGPGLSEILAIPEAFMNRQISPDSFKNYVALKKSADENGSSIVIKEGRFEECGKHCDNEEAIEEGTDTLDPSINLFDLDSNGTSNCNNSCSSISVYSKKNIANTFIQTEQNESNIVSLKEEDKDSKTRENSDCSSEIEQSDEKLLDNPLTVRTDALLTTKSFNLVKTKSSL